MSLAKARSLFDEREGQELLVDLPQVTDRLIAVVHDRFGRELDRVYQLDAA